MRKMKVVFPVAIMALATGLALASANTSEEAISGKFIQLPGECRAVPEAACGNGDAICTYEGQQVYGIQNDANPTQCTFELRKSL
jgi:hypothetical protein